MPHRFEEFGNPLAGRARDPEEGQLQLGGPPRQRFDPPGIVHRIDLVRGYELRFGGQRRLEQLQLMPHRVEIAYRIATARARDVHDVDEYFGSLEMTQELVAESEAAMSALDEPGHVSNDEAAIVTEAHDAKIRRQRRERIVSDLRPRRRDARDKRRLAGVRKSHQADVGEQLEFEPQILDLALFARLHLPRRAVGCRRKARVAQPAAAAARDEHALTDFGEIGEEAERFIAIAGFLVDERTDRHVELEVPARVAGAVRSFAVAAALGRKFRMEAEVDEGV